MRALVLFYSWHGNTKKMAELIAKETGADIFAIEPEEAYSTNSHVRRSGLLRAEDQLHS